MRAFWFNGFAGLLSGLTLLAQAPNPSTPGELSVGQIVARMANRAGDDSIRTNNLRHTWRRVTVIEDFDSRGRVEERRSKEHRVIARQGDQEATLIKLNGQTPPERVRSREVKKEAENREKFAQRGDRRSERRGNIEIDAKLIQRFRYQWLSNEVVDGRWAYVLSFAPGVKADGGKIADRILGNLGGRIWVDSDVFEVARIEAGLLEQVHVGGFIAEVSKLSFEVDRRPLPDGPWVNVKLVSQAAGRKLFDRFSGRMEVRQEDFEALPLEAVSTSAVR